MPKKTVLPQHQEWVEVSAPSRVHITLSDLGRTTFRAYGGLGFAVDTPRVQLKLVAGKAAEITGVELDASARNAVRQTAAYLASLAGGKAFSVSVQALPGPHSGLGSKTSLLLGLIAGASELFNLKLSQADIQKISGRGGTSGIGIHSFFEGGVIWDGGHPQEKVPRLIPSSGSSPEVLPPCLARLEFPSAWHVCLIKVKGENHSGERERQIFADQTPIPHSEVLDVIGLIAHGVLPAFKEVSLPALAPALRMINETGFKAREVASQSNNVSKLLQALYAEGLAGGMSSLGPTIFVIADATDRDAHMLIDSIAAAYPTEVSWTKGSNSGATIGRSCEA